MRSGVWTSRRVLSFRRPGWSLGMSSEWGGWPSRLPPFRRLCPQHLLAWAGPGIGAWHWCRRCWGWQTRALCPPRGVGCRRKHCTACVPGGLCPSSGPPPPRPAGPRCHGWEGRLPSVYPRWGRSFRCSRSRPWPQELGLVRVLGNVANTLHPQNAGLQPCCTWAPVGTEWRCGLGSQKRGRASGRPVARPVCLGLRKLPARPPRSQSARGGGRSGRGWLA